MKKLYISPCPECGRNDQIVMVRNTLRREFSCACYRCDYFGPTSRTRRGAVQKWNRYSDEQRHKTVTSNEFTVIVKKEGKHDQR